MVRTPERSLPAAGLTPTLSVTPAPRHATRPAGWPASRRRHRSIAATLRLLDDDPFLLCDCEDGAPHTCG